MRKVFLLLCCTFVLFADKEADFLIKEIRENKAEPISEFAKNPFESSKEIDFIVQKQKNKKVNSRLVFHSILGKNVLINNKWYKKGDFVAGMKLVKIGDHFIILSLSNKSKRRLELAKNSQQSKVQIGISK